MTVSSFLPNRLCDVVAHDSGNGKGHIQNELTLYHLSIADPLCITKMMAGKTNPNNY